MAIVEDTLNFFTTCPANTTTELTHKLPHRFRITGIWIRFNRGCEDQFTIKIYIGGSIVGFAVSGTTEGFQGDDETIYIPHNKEYQPETEVKVEGVNAEAFVHTMQVRVGYQFETEE